MHTTVTSIPLVDPHALPANASIGELVRDATTQMSTLVRAEVELAKAEITRDVKRGLTGSVFFVVAGVVLLYSTFFMFFFLAELLDTWMVRWAAFLIVFILMLLATALFALLGYRKVRRIRGPQQAIESVKETTAALTPSLARFAGTSTAPELAAPAVTLPRAAAPAPAERPLAPPRPVAAPQPETTRPTTTRPPTTNLGPTATAPPAAATAPEPHEAPVHEAPTGIPEAIVYGTPETDAEIVVYEPAAPHAQAGDADEEYDPTAAVFADPDAPATLDSHRLPRDPTD